MSQLLSKAVGTAVATEIKKHAAKGDYPEPSEVVTIVQKAMEYKRSKLEKLLLTSDEKEGWEERIKKHRHQRELLIELQSFLKDITNV